MPTLQTLQMGRRSSDKDLGNLTLMSLEAVNIAQKLSTFTEHWSPRIVAELNGQLVKLVKLKGEFVWHDHADEDEMFLVLSGTLHMEFRDRMVMVRAGEFIVVPRGVEHKPFADEEVELILFEPASTKHTGAVESERTVANQPRI